MNAAYWLLSVWVGLSTVLLWAALAATARHFGRSRPRPEPGPVLPMTLIKPVRGLDDGMRENFESIVASDPSGALQVLIAIETEADPAYPVARAFAAAHPARDISVVLTGPAGGRMGKIHNMIEALPRAKHERVIFSDADTRTTRALVEGTSAAFASGHDAVYAMPYHVPSAGLGGLCFWVAFNHFFAVLQALAYQAGQYHFYAGAWMAYTKESLRRVGGLEPFAHIIADDASIGLRVSAAGGRKALLRAPVLVSETGTSPRQAYDHLTKWCIMGRWVAPWAYRMIPVVGPGLPALLLLALGGKTLFLAYVLSRMAVAWLQDTAVSGRAMPLSRYLVLATADLGMLVFWASGFRSRLLWRGTTYRLFVGGRVEVIS